MNPISPQSLKPFARKYLWWKTPEEAVTMPESVIAQVMNIGDYADVQALASQVGDEVLRQVLTHARPGQFNARSRVYWHYRHSVDFDFFSEKPLDWEAIKAAFPFIAQSTTLQDQPNSVTPCSPTLFSVQLPCRKPKK